MTVVPVGAGDSIASAVTAVVQEIDDVGLNYELNGASTVIEAEWNEVMPVLKRAESALRQTYGRVFMLITVDDHPGRDRLHRAAQEVETQLEHTIPLA
ncbi:MAG: thiamine-binding protein [Gemmatimonadota bacterium]